MLARLRDHLEATGLAPPGSRILAAYSGGADSTCMVHLMHALGYFVAAAHLNHGQRPEADEEADRCRTFAESLGIPFVAGIADVPRLAADRGIGLEEAGRQARYAFFDRAARQAGCPLIATGHTRTDLVETMILHLARGAGIAGLAGIPEKRGAIVRPMLIFDRTETRAYCQERGLWTFDDPSNEDLAFARARVRHRVVPELEAVHPGFLASAARLARLAAEEDRFLDAAAAAALERAEVRPNGQLHFLTEDCEAHFDRRTLAHFPPVLGRRALRLAVRALGGSLDFSQTEIAWEGLASGTGGAVTAEGGEVVVEWNSEKASVRSLAAAGPFRHALEVPGETESEVFGWLIAAHSAPADPADQKRAGLTAVLSTHGLSGNLYFRTAETGDAIEPLGFPHRRKLSDILAESGLTLAARQRLPIICDMAGPIWVPGICLSNRVQLQGRVSDAIHLRFGPLGPGSGESETMASDPTYAN